MKRTQGGRTEMRKSIISNCKKELLYSISDCILNVLNGNVKLIYCSTRKLRNHKTTLRNVGDYRVSLSTNKKLIVQRSGFLLLLLSAVLPPIASLIFSRRDNVTKIYLVSAEMFPQGTPKHTSPTKEHKFPILPHPSPSLPTRNNINA